MLLCQDRERVACSTGAFSGVRERCGTDCPEEVKEEQQAHERQRDAQALTEPKPDKYEEKHVKWDDKEQDQQEPEDVHLRGALY